MKAVIVDLLNGQAAALCDDGRVIRLADAGYTLGQIVEVHERKRRANWLRLISAAAAAAVLLVGGGGAAAYAMPYGVVSLDVNPAIEYTINRFDYVLRVEGVNEDGRALLTGMDEKSLVHRPIGEALEASVAALEAGEWLGETGGEILLAAGTKEETHTERLVNALGDRLRREDDSLEVRTVTVSEAEIESARAEGVSAGRQHMLDALSAREGADFAPGEWRERPIGDLFDRLEGGPDTAGEPHPETPARESGAPQAAQPEERAEPREMQPEERAEPAFSQGAPAERTEAAAPEGQDGQRETEREAPAGIGYLLA